MRRFILLREHDVSGVSGVGRVAVGCQFPDGRCVLMWLSPVLPQELHGALSIYASVAEMEAVHGHGGHTKIEWYDE